MRGRRCGVTENEPAERRLQPERSTNFAKARGTRCSVRVHARRRWNRLGARTFWSFYDAFCELLESSLVLVP